LGIEGEKGGSSPLSPVKRESLKEKQLKYRISPLWKHLGFYLLFMADACHPFFVRERLLKGGKKMGWLFQRNAQGRKGERVEHG